MNRVFVFIFVFIVLVFFAGFADEYEFDPEETKKKPFEISGYAEFIPAVGFFNERSVLYLLTFPEDMERAFLDSYQLNGFLQGSFDFWNFKLAASGLGSVSYQPQLFKFGVDLFEAFLLYSANSEFSIWTGKKTVKWGKGYIWNPVSYAGRQKDINNIEANMEGYYAFSTEYITTFSSTVLKILSFEALFLPVYYEINENYTPQNSSNLVGRVYFLFFDTDIDFYAFFNNKDQQKYGVDFSRNIFTVLEMHGEFSYEFNVNRYMIDHTLTLKNELCDGYKYIAGVRYLTPFNVTIILEYLHNEYGFNTKEIDYFFDYIDKKLLDKDDLDSVMTAKKIYDDYYAGQFVMRNYLYLKVSMPELFGFLYFTPHVFCSFNLNDFSLLSGMELNYTRFKNILLAAKYNFIWGQDRTGTDLKLFGHKVELKFKIYF